MKTSSSGKRNVVACDLGARLDGDNLEADEPALGQFSVSNHPINIRLVEVLGAFHVVRRMPCSRVSKVEEKKMEEKVSA